VEKTIYYLEELCVRFPSQVMHRRI